MPYPLANLTPRAIRVDVASIIGDDLPLETTSGGTSTTAIFSSLIGTPLAYIQNKHLLIEEGEEDSEWRVASNFAPATGTITVRNAYSGAIASAMSAHLHEFSPHLYVAAINEASAMLSLAVTRPILYHHFVRDPGWQRSIALPRDMERVLRVLEDGEVSEAMRDYIDRPDSGVTAGPLWRATIGQWGVSSDAIYCVSDTNNDMVETATDTFAQNGIIQAVVRGDTTAAAFRVITLQFRKEDDTNYLGVNMVNGALNLIKVDGGTESTLATVAMTTTENVDYVVRIMFDGPRIRVWVDDRELLNHELLGQNLQYLGYREDTGETYHRVGFRLDKTGSPSLAATATVVRNYFVHRLVTQGERMDWERSPDRKMIRLNTMNRGHSLSEGRLIWVEGIAPLSEISAPVFEELVNDTTVTVQIERTDPAYQVLTNWAAYLVLDKASNITSTGDPAKRAEYTQRAERQLMKAQELRASKGMKYLARSR